VINAVEPPVCIRGISNLPRQIRDEIESLNDVIGQTRAGFRTMNGRKLEVYVGSDPSSGS
jgi:hypothetical protein